MADYQLFADVTADLCPEMLKVIEKPRGRKRAIAAQMARMDAGPDLLGRQPINDKCFADKIS